MKLAVGGVGFSRRANRPLVVAVIPEAMVVWPDFAVVRANTVRSDAVLVDLQGYASQLVTPAQAAAGVRLVAIPGPPPAAWGAPLSLEVTPYRDGIPGLTAVRSVVAYPWTFGWSAHSAVVTGSALTWTSLDGSQLLTDTAAVKTTLPGWKEPVIQVGNPVTANPAAFRALFSTQHMAQLTLWEPLDRIATMRFLTMSQTFAYYGLQHGDNEYWYCRFDAISGIRYMTLPPDYGTPRAWLVRYDGTRTDWERAHMWRDESDAGINKVANPPYTALDHGSPFTSGPTWLDAAVGSPADRSLGLTFVLLNYTPPDSELLAVSAFQRARYFE